MPKERNVVLYHADCTDGFCSAFIAQQHFSRAEPRIPSEYIPCKYGEFISVNCIDAHIYILDFSFPPEIMSGMALHCASLTILDHHKTAQENLQKFIERWTGDPRVCCIFDMNRSGAGITWEHFHPLAEMPMFVKHVQDYDLWKFKYLETAGFNQNLNSYPKNFTHWESIWNRTFCIEGNKSLNQPYQNFIREGEAQLRLFEQQVAIFCRNAIDGKLDNYNVKVVNCPATHASLVGNLLCQQMNVDFSISYYIDTHLDYIFSLRSKGDIDVSAIAKQFAGGGHKNAAGFRMPGRAGRSFIVDMCIAADKRNNQEAKG